MPAAVRVMTVHQAKGLEFDMVVLPELEVDPVGQPPAFVAHHPDVTGPPIGCAAMPRKPSAAAPGRWQQMFTDATDAAVSESLCVLYVAMTRAVHALHAIIAPSKPKEGPCCGRLPGCSRGTQRWAARSAGDGVVRARPATVV